jgi:hypothetical protein
MTRSAFLERDIQKVLVIVTTATNANVSIRFFTLKNKNKGCE